MSTEPAPTRPRKQTPLEEVSKKTTGTPKIYSVKDHPLPMVTFFDSAEGKTLPYMDLTEIQWLEAIPDRLKCIFSGWDVIITGRRLRPLWDDLSLHQVFRIEVDTRASALKENENATIAMKMEFIEHAEPPEPAVDESEEPAELEP